MLCCAVLCCAVLCCAVLCCAVLCCAVLCCAVLCCAVLCCAVLCCAPALGTWPCPEQRYCATFRLEVRDYPLEVLEAAVHGSEYTVCKSSVALSKVRIQRR